MVPCLVGRAEAVVRAAMIAVALAAPNAPPTVRITVLIPVAIPTSDCGTDSTIRFGHRREART